MIRSALIAATLVFCGAQASVAMAQAPNNVLEYRADQLTGQWVGVYLSGDQSTSFTATMFHDGQSLIGSTVEGNSFGDPTAAFLLADLSGSVRGNRVTFDKTYNGVGGQTHTVRYSGTVSRDGRRIVGTWTLAALSGSFEMVR
jgi:hypothetical protein